MYLTAFPDLNDVAPDGSYSAKPTRGRYSFPLHFFHNPFTGPDTSRPWFHERAIEWGLTHRFEVTHLRLATSELRYTFRVEQMGPFYTTLANALRDESRIEVPLVPDPQGYPLQRAWFQIQSWMQRTRAKDEAISLLSTLASINDPELRSALERRWIEEETAADPEFSEIYAELRSRFDPDRCSTDEDSYAFCESILVAAHYNDSALPDALNSIPENLSGEAWSNEVEARHAEWMRMRRRRLQYPFHPPNPPPTSDLDRFQRVLGIFANDVEVGVLGQPKIGCFNTRLVDSGIGISVLKVAANEVCGILVKSFFDDAGRNSTDDAVYAFIVSAVFFESLRQQICRGVGLVCPMWEGGSCCGDPDTMIRLQRAWRITEPWHPGWRSHWRRPPCFDQPVIYRP